MKSIKICKWHACKGRNSQYVFDWAANALGLPESEGGKTEDWEFSLEFCSCLWKCDRAVNAKIEDWKNSQLHSNLDPLKMRNIVKNLKNQKDEKWLKN